MLQLIEILCSRHVKNIQAIYIVRKPYVLRSSQKIYYSWFCSKITFENLFGDDEAIDSKWTNIVTHHYIVVNML